MQCLGEETVRSIAEFSKNVYAVRQSMDVGVSEANFDLRASIQREVGH